MHTKGSIRSLVNSNPVAALRAARVILACDVETRRRGFKRSSFKYGCGRKRVDAFLAIYLAAGDAGRLSAKMAWNLRGNLWHYQDLLVDVANGVVPNPLKR